MGLETVTGNDGLGVQFYWRRRDERNLGTFDLVDVKLFVATFLAAISLGAMVPAARLG